MFKNFLFLVLIFTILIPQIFCFSAGTGITLKKKVSSVKIIMDEEEAENDNEDEEQAKEKICFDPLNVFIFKFIISCLRFLYSNPYYLLAQSWEMISPPPEVV